jgi:F0F1-type ATP synthase delta subunit
MGSIVDEYDSVCADAGMLIAELERAKALIAELAKANAALVKRTKEAEGRVVETTIPLTDEQKERLSTRGEIPSGVRKWWKL